MICYVLSKYIYLFIIYYLLELLTLNDDKKKKNDFYV